MTNLEGRILRRQRMVPPAPGVRSDTEIIKGLADRIGRGTHFDADPRTVFDELRRASAGGQADYSGVTWERIEAEEGIFWPCPEPGHPGTPRPFLSRFATPSGRARFHPVEHRATAEEPDPHFPLFLTTGRGHGAIPVRHADAPRARPRPGRSRNPSARSTSTWPGPSASRTAIPVRLTTRRGAATMRARLTRTIRLDTVFVPFHWGGDGCANLLTSTFRDPVSLYP